MRLVVAIAVSAVAIAVSLPAAASSRMRNGSLLFEVVPTQVHSGAGGPVHLWAAGAHGTSSRDLGVVAGNADQFADARYTPDGRRIVFLHVIDDPGDPEARDSLDVMNADGSGRRVLVRRPHVSQFAISPDGASVAYLAVDRKTVWSLYVTRIEHPRPLLLRHSWPPAAFRWSKDGTMIVFGSQGRCETRLRRVDPNTGKAHPLPVSARLCEGLHQAPAVSPDERRIAFYSPFGPAGARVFATDGRFLRNIVGPYRCVGPFSPDGTQLALADSCGGTVVHLSVFDFLSRTVELLTPHVPVPAGGYDRLLDWQPLGAGG